ncbi:hypothetical protein [Streptomyces sp. NPDC058486]|uniref:hypothetical protein n=1 Tax=unclassified Streptomyces TaxID=2593676 RepID=UPI003668DE87
MTTTRGRLMASAVLAPALALTLTACGGDGRDYTVPEAACGVPLDEKVLSPFLVDGERLTVTGDSVVDPPQGKTWSRCELRVDGALVVGLQVDRVDKLYDPMHASEEYRFRSRAKMTGLPFSGLGAVGDSNSMVATPCSGPGVDHLIAYVSVDGGTEGGSGTAERREAIETFTLDFVPKVKKELGCTA